MEKLFEKSRKQKVKKSHHLHIIMVGLINDGVDLQFSDEGNSTMNIWRNLTLENPVVMEHTLATHVLVRRAVRLRRNSFLSRLQIRRKASFIRVGTTMPLADA